jgi:hypothetical protein
MSADPHIQHPDNLASYNRYSYVYNTPLSATDPSGYFLKWLARTIRNEYRRSELFRAAVAIGAAWAGGWGMEQLLLGAPLTAGEATLFATLAPTTTGAALTTAGTVAVGAAGGFAGSLVASGGDLKAAAQGALTGGAFGYVGASWGGGTLESYAAHAAVGCGSAMMGGGNCARGAASQVISKWVTVNTDDWHPAGQFAAATVSGGAVSLVTGGKFANGAQTAAFGYLFNAALAKLSGYIYKRGGVHHQMPNAVARDMEWSDAAVKVFDENPFNPPLRGQRHDRIDELTHAQYNKDVEAFTKEWTKTNGVDPKNATAEQAQKFTYDLRYNAPASVMNFNRNLWMKEIMRNTYWVRPTE